jgi:hypothetical protein
MLELPVVPDAQGDLAFAEGDGHVPFPIARVFFVYGVPGDAVRGGHAHLEQHEALFCVHGRLDIALDDGTRRETITLDQPHQGIHLPPLIWYDLDGFTSDTVYLALTSAAFEESDYIRDYQEYLARIGVAKTAS